MGRPAKDMTGQKCGEWTVIRRSPSESTKSALWLCRCSCGNTGVVQGTGLRNGSSTMCKECAGKSIRTHYMSKTREYSIWLGIKQRCFNEGSTSWNRYGKRGITMSSAWIESFEQFYSDMGPRPSVRHSIERIDNDGNYEASNCRWATSREQSLNSRRNVRWTHQGETLTISEWAERVGIDQGTLWMRVRSYRWSVAKALTTPV